MYNKDKEYLMEKLNGLLQECETLFDDYMENNNIEEVEEDNKDYQFVCEVECLIEHLITSKIILDRNMR